MPTAVEHPAASVDRREKWQMWGQIRERIAGRSGEDSEVGSPLGTHASLLIARVELSIAAAGRSCAYFSWAYCQRYPSLRRRLPLLGLLADRLIDDLFVLIYAKRGWDRGRNRFAPRGK